MRQVLLSANDHDVAGLELGEMGVVALQRGNGRVVSAGDAGEGFAALHLVPDYGLAGRL